MGSKHQMDSATTWFILLAYDAAVYQAAKSMLAFCILAASVPVYIVQVALGSPV